MTDYTPPCSSQDLNHFLAGPQLTMSHFTSNDFANYNCSPHPQYEFGSPIYSNFATPLLSSHHSGAQYLTDTLQMAAQYQYRTSSYHRSLAEAGGYACHQLPQQHLIPSSRYLAPCDSQPYEDIECQESMNEDTMLSEPYLPSLEGFPHVSDFDLLVNGSVSFPYLYMPSPQLTAINLVTSKAFLPRSKTRLSSMPVGLEISRPC